MYVANETRHPGLITALRRGPTSSTRWAGTSAPKRTLDCASPTAGALVIGMLAACFLRPVSASACISVPSSPAPRSMFVSTYSGTTSKSSPGKTTRCSTRGTSMLWSASVALFMSAVSVCKRGLGVVERSMVCGDGRGERSMDCGDGRGERSMVCGDGRGERSMDCGDGRGERSMVCGDGRGERSMVCGDGRGERSMVFEERSQAVLERGQRRAYGHVHVEVFIRAEPPAEEHALLAVGHLAVGQQ